jgi:AcrR family transcriptional regulator
MAEPFSMTSEEIFKDAQDLTAREVSSRRVDVLRAVANLIAEHGIDGMSMRQVADAAGLSTGTINYYFRNKQTLIAAAMDYVYSLPADRDAHRNKPALEQIRNAISIFSFTTEGHRRWWRFWLEYAARAARDQDLMDSHDERYTRQRRYFRALIDAGREDRELRPDIDVDETVDTLLALIDGLATHQIINSRSVNPARAAHLLERFLESLTAPPA